MEMKPCPFCGGEAEESWNQGYWQIKCYRCDASVFVKQGNSQLTDYRKEAIVKWNTRPTPQTPGGAVEAMCKAIAPITEITPTYDHVQPAVHGYLKAKINTALTAAAALGYTLAPDKRTLPELEEIKRGFTFILDISQEELPYTKVGSGAEVALWHIHRRALERLNAISKIDGGKL